MICPHCRRTIREEERYLMSRHDRVPGEPLVPAWARWPAALLMLGFLVGLLLAVSGSG